MTYKNPFIKVEWEDSPENFTKERIKRVKEYFQNKYNTKDVKIIPKSLTNNSTTKLKSLEVSDNIMDYQYQKKLIKEFIKENKIEIEWELIDRLDNKVNSEVDKNNQINTRFNKWVIKKIEFSNFLSFGDDNVIDFTDLEGITVIEGSPNKNFAGKSTLSTDLILFLFFNKTTKSKTNAEVFNTFRDCNEVKVKGYVEIDGDEYIIERIITRKQTKSGDFNVKNELNFYKIENGELLNLSGEQRRETENIITSAIGTEEDFLLTILTTGYNLEELIESKPTARGMILTRFLGLDFLKQKEEICKTMYSEWSKKLVSNTYNITQLTSENETNTEFISRSEESVRNLETKLNEYEDKLTELDNRRDLLLQLRNNDINEELFKINPENIQKEIDYIFVQQTKIKENIDLINVVDPSQYYNEEEHDVIKRKINDLTIEINTKSIDVKGKQKLITELQNSTVCPTCKQSLKDVDHTEEIKILNENVQELNKTIEELSNQKTQKEVEELTFLNLKKEYETYEREKLRKERYQLEYEQKQLEITNKQNKISEYNSNKKKLDENKKIDEEVTVLKVKIETEKGNIRTTNNEISTTKNKIDNSKEKIKTNEELIKKIKLEEEFEKTFKIYLSIFGKNGISKTIMKNMIPLLNQELHQLMVDSCYFTLDVNINDKNELEFIMIDNETRIVKLLNSGSGYEKTISSLAIRSVLTKVSSLPKPNIVVMDEVFGKVADENLEMVGEFFKKIKEYFEHILVISHNTLIRNWSDNILMVKKEENVSSIEYINTKIH